MENKCNKYESLFIFGNEEELNKHIKECPYCAEEHAKMKKISNLIQETKPHYMRKKTSKKIALKAIAAIFFVCTVFFAFNTNTSNKNDINIALNDSPSVVEKMGLPTDEYGLFMVY